MLTHAHLVREDLEEDVAPGLEKFLALQKELLGGFSEPEFQDSFPSAAWGVGVGVFFFFTKNTAGSCEAFGEAGKVAGCCSKEGNLGWCAK